jgi:hypothetical protein
MQAQESRQNGSLAREAVSASDSPGEQTGSAFPCAQWTFASSSIVPLAAGPRPRRPPDSKALGSSVALRAGSLCVFGHEGDGPAGDAEDVDRIRALVRFGVAVAGVAVVFVEAEPARPAGDEGHDGIIAIGPFNCLPFRISEAVLKPYSMQKGIPILAYESDGFSVTPALLRQVEVHIQQVLAVRPGQGSLAVRS